MRVLCVCLGNICRSPTAEVVLRELSGNRLVVDSAGTACWQKGNAPYGPAIAAAAMRGYDLSSLKARQFDAEDFQRFDLILAMDTENQDDIEALRPKGNKTPVRLLLEYAPQTGVRDVPDPYFTRDFEQALDLIEAGASGAISSLRSP